MREKKLKEILIEQWQKILDDAIEKEEYEIAAKAKKIIDNLNGKRITKEVNREIK